ncbi:MAG: hypothetical protein M3R24_26180 [Chloroflexota bacterium]|nr:hypothetical protein [Chloroflexota bacterium]
MGNGPDLLYEVKEGAWYGWPDFIGGDPITDAQYQPERGPAPSFVLANHTDLPPPEHALLRFPPHVAAVKFATAPDRRWHGRALRTGQAGRGSSCTRSQHDLVVDRSDTAEA